VNVLLTVLMLKMLLVIALAKQLPKNILMIQLLINKNVIKHARQLTIRLIRLKMVWPNVNVLVLLPQNIIKMILINALQVLTLLLLMLKRLDALLQPINLMLVQELVQILAPKQKVKEQQLNMMQAQLHAFVQTQHNIKKEQVLIKHVMLALLTQPEVLLLHVHVNKIMHQLGKMVKQNHVK